MKIRSLSPTDGHDFNSQMLATTHLESTHHQNIIDGNKQVSKEVEIIDQKDMPVSRN